MKTRLVLWGTNAENARVMLAISLRASDNKVDVWAFPEEVATESFYKRMIDEWRFGRDLPFPDTFTQYEVPFTSSGNLLPDGLTADKNDLLLQAQTEWQFVVLSARLYESYKEELEFLKEKMDRLNQFDQKVWEELKGFWEKVQGQIHERVLFRDHAAKLREKINVMFDKMKAMRRALDSEFKVASKEALDKFMSALDEIEASLREDRGLHPIFEELKKLQQSYHTTSFTREDRNKVWKRLDAAFKAVKEKRFGSEPQRSSSALGRLERRLEGLKAAINKMEKSIQHDQRDIDFEQTRIAESHGQLEAQIRQARLAMIEERIKSKQEKLADMYKTRSEIEARIEKEQKREAARKEKEEREKLKEQVEETLKEKIAEDIRHAAEIREQDADKLEKAAEEIVEAKKKPRRKPKESLAGAAGEVLGESLQDLGDTIRAVADVVADKIREAFDPETQEKSDESHDA